MRGDETVMDEEMLLGMAGHDCWQCHDGGHACDYGDEIKDCYKRGRPVLVTYPDGDSWLYFLCREHEASRMLTVR